MKKWAIPSLVPFWYHLVPHHQTLPKLVYKLFKPFWTTISNCIFCLNEHRKTFISKGVDFRVFNDNATKWRTHLTYFIITALLYSLLLYWPNIHILCVIKYDPPLTADMRHSALDLSQRSQRFLPENISCFVSSLESLGKSSENDYSKVYDKGATSLVSCDCATPHHSSNFMQDKA